MIAQNSIDKSPKISEKEMLNTLEGEVEWWYQKNAAEVVMRHLSGIRGLSDSLRVQSTDRIPLVVMGIEVAKE